MKFTVFIKRESALFSSERFDNMMSDSDEIDGSRGSGELEGKNKRNVNNKIRIIAHPATFFYGSI